MGRVLLEAPHLVPCGSGALNIPVILELQFNLRDVRVLNYLGSDRALRLSGFRYPK